MGASFGGNVVSVNAIGSDGRVAAEPLQVIPVGRNAHAIRVEGLKVVLRGGAVLDGVSLTAAPGEILAVTALGQPILPRK